MEGGFAGFHMVDNVAKQATSVCLPREAESCPKYIVNVFRSSIIAILWQQPIAGDLAALFRNIV
jgi:hypothetical protein